MVQIDVISFYSDNALSKREDKNLLTSDGLKRPFVVPRLKSLCGLGSCVLGFVGKIDLSR